MTRTLVMHLLETRFVRTRSKNVMQIISSEQKCCGSCFTARVPARAWSDRSAGPGRCPSHPRSESQNHRIVGVGRDLCGSSGPTLLPKQGHPEQGAQHRVQVGLEYLQRRRLHSLPGQPVPATARMNQPGLLRSPSVTKDLEASFWVAPASC